MIKFNELYVTPDGGNLVIDASVLKLPYYDNILIDRIYVDTQDTYVEGGPSSKATKVFDSSGNRSVRLVITDKSFHTLDIKNNLLIVYVRTKGTPSPDTPCGMDESMVEGMTFNVCPIYNSTMNSIKETLNDCEVPKNFIDSYLRFKVLEMSIETNHTADAVKWFNKFFKDNKEVKSHKCGCHG